MKREKERERREIDNTTESSQTKTKRCYPKKENHRSQITEMEAAGQKRKRERGTVFPTHTPEGVWGGGRAYVGSTCPVPPYCPWGTNFCAPS